ncbi:translation initiation factor IF-3, mitochondrial [Kryptolebias marmoratus]|uniref:Mitochondrial translational initiation factor 3 n=1 Tax=Kryptolebias marmoratus TaxID=37003 RepID=A0A3Q3BKF4_KRYMA|nr:translation initiation factor IF-3, mitochondrial [Kryptolebias marmoratus]
MSAGCVRWLLSHAVRAACRGKPVWTPASRLPICSRSHNVIAATWGRSPFSTEADDVKQTPAAKKAKRDTQGPASISNVGRKIPHKEVQLIGDSGEELGVMQRTSVIKLMDERHLKLVLLNEHKKPPVYQLMSGKQLHEEQLKLLKKEKAKAATVLVKELSFSVGISSHDLSTKQKQVESWLERKHHVRITLQAKKNKPDASLDTVLEQIVEQMTVIVGFVSQPKVIRDGRAATCTLRPPSKKELLQKGAQKAAESVSPTSEETRNKTPPAGDEVTSEEYVQQ